MQIALYIEAGDQVFLFRKKKFWWALTNYVRFATCSSQRGLNFELGLK